MLNQSLRKEFDRAISKWIARDSSGKIYLLARSPDYQGKLIFTLRVAKKKYPSSIKDFSQPLEIFSPSGLIKIKDAIFSAGMVIDQQDNLHLVYCTDNGLSGYTFINLKQIKNYRDLKEKSFWLNPRNKKPGVLVLAKSNSKIGDISLAPDGGVWLVWTVTQMEHQVSIYVGRWFNGKFDSFKVTEGYGFSPPSIFISCDHRFHLAWHNIYEDGYYLSGKISDLDKKQIWQVKKLIDRVRRPVMTESKDKILTVYENDWSFLEYIFPEEKIHRRCFLTWPDKRFTWDTSHSPQFVVDKYGIPWLFFIESTRQHIFYTRWLGTNWSQIYNGPWLTKNSPRMEDNHLSIERLSVEERMLDNASGIGITITHENQYPQTSFLTIRVPSLKAEHGKKVLFFDMKEIKDLRNISLHLNKAKKYKDNPVIMAGGPNDFDAHGGGGFLRVIKENNVYRMWYSGVFIEPKKPWWEWSRVGYAESRDGYKFKKINLGLTSFRGKKNTNIIPELPYVPMLCYDSHDPNPERRYKLLKLVNQSIQNNESKAGRLNPWSESFNGTLFTSPDGIHWKKEKAVINFPGGKPFSFIPQCLFYDKQEKDPNKKYKAYGFSSLNLARRGGSYAYSPDCIHWTAHPQNPILDPFARGIPVVRGGKVEQIHDTVVWQYHGYYLALFQHQYHGEKLDVELAVSRDGENFTFVKPGEKVISLGNSGEWDCSIISPSVPLVDGDEIKLYYGGIGKYYVKENKTGSNLREKDIKRSGGLATLRLDGFTHLQLEGNCHKGSLTTIPIIKGRVNSLWVNADCRKGSYLQVELIDATTGKVIPNYSRNECSKITGNSVSQKVVWKNKVNLSGIKTSSFQIKFYFFGEKGFPKLYSFEFK